MTRLKKVFLVICLISTLLACEKEINLSLENVDEKLVVDATIENEKAPQVILTKSLNYFGKLDPIQLANSFVSGAIVSISDGTKSVQLKELTFPRPENTKLIVYSLDSTNPSAILIGKLNTQYTLTINVGGKSYESTTFIPPLKKKHDSIWWRPAAPPAPENKAEIFVRSFDPPGFGDYIRYYTKVNNEPFYPGLNSVFDDQFVDGTTYSIQVERGVNRNLATIEDEDLLFSRGDTVIVKVSNIDKKTYDFWRTIEFNLQSIGNPFSSPTVVLGNISNGALGYFGGYASSQRTLIIPKQ